MDGLAGHVMTELELDPFNGAVFIFRSKRADTLKMIVWDGTGMVVIHKRIEGRGFVWPGVRNGTVQLSRTQFEALFEGLDWRRIATARQHRPVAVQGPAPGSAAAFRIRPAARLVFPCVAGGERGKPST